MGHCENVVPNGLKAAYDPCGAMQSAVGSDLEWGGGVNVSAVEARHSTPVSVQQICM